MFWEGGMPKPPGAVPRAEALDPVSLNRKKSLSLSLTTWSNRTLVESSELGLDQLPLNSAQPSPKSCPLGTGKAFNTGCSSAGAGLSLPVQVAACPRKQRFGTPKIAAGCG